MRDRATPASATHPVPQRPPTPRVAGSGGRLQARVQRRALAGRRRVVHRVEQLGPAWRIVDYHPEDPDFLAIGPGGVFQVTVADHGRTKVQLAGDVVQIAGQRPPVRGPGPAGRGPDLQADVGHGRFPDPGDPGGRVPGHRARSSY